MKPEADVPQTFGPVFLIVGMLTVYAYLTGYQDSQNLAPWKVLFIGIFCLAFSLFWFWEWYDIRKHPEKWRSAR